MPTLYQIIDALIEMLEEDSRKKGLTHEEFKKLDACKFYSSIYQNLDEEAE